MAEGTEKSIRERIEETRMKQAIKIQEETVSSSAVWDCHRAEHDGITEENIKEHVEECLGEMLNNYIEDERNYALDGAVISCDQMSDKEVFIQFTENGSKISIKGGGEPITSEYTKPNGIGPDGGQEYMIFSHVGEDNIRKLHAVSGNSQSDNGIRFATVIDRSYLREEVEENQASIVSCGNCKKLEEKDIKKIAENWDGVCKYGTCYALMQLASNWINPYCMESIAGECKRDDSLPPLTVFDAIGHTLEYATCVIEHHRPIKFSTTEGEKEGLTMMSTLLCGKEGIITIEASGQIYVEPKAVNEEDADMKAALDKMTQYLKGEGISEEELNEIISWVAENCGLTVKDMIQGQFSEAASTEAHERSKMFDEQIIAWTYYWNVKIQEDVSFETKFTIDPNVVKAIIAQESSFGLVKAGEEGKNASRNVMQSLAVGNDTVWVASGINPFHDNMFCVGDEIAYKMLDGTVETDGYLVGTDEPTHLATTYMDKDKFDWYRKNQHYNDFDILKSIFEVGEDGRYMVVFDNVTTNMSIATGIGCLANKIVDEDENMYLGVRDYNSKENNNYPELINGHLEDMGYSGEELLQNNTTEG